MLKFQIFLASLHASFRTTRCNVVEKALHVMTGHGSDRQTTQQWLDMTLNSSCIDRQRALSFRLPATLQHATGPGILQVEIAELGQSDRLAASLFLRSRVAALSHFAEQALRFNSGGIWRPRSAMSAYRVPTLPLADSGSILKDIRNPRTGLSPRRKSGHNCVPDYAALA